MDVEGAVVREVGIEGKGSLLFMMVVFEEEGRGLLQKVVENVGVLLV